MQKTLIYLGLVLVVVGLLWPWLGRLPLGRLPGDIQIDRPGFRLYIPLGTMLLISAVLSLLASIFKR
ncbi:MAG: DUF2905 domain-containing protein [Porticoccaceae bacterium]|jgi:hypothetical protein|nr:DUF2905 domain-containing protein [Gammaproteobacteria bacterium]TAL06385.1 MAG: DUF2905 domain-containing protein [Porticoccaceae bacterium]